MIGPTETRWRKSRRCASNTCAEVAQVDEHYLIRDSKNPEAAPLRFTRDEWQAFVDGIKNGDFDFA